MFDKNEVVVVEEVVLSKYEGEALPENEFERMHIRDGAIVSVSKIQNGVVVETTMLGGE